MSSQASKAGLELTIQTPAFGYNQKQLESSNQPVIAHNIRTNLSHSLGFSMSQTFNQTGSREQKDQPISMIGHGHSSQQGVYALEPSFYCGADKHTIIMGHDHIAHIKLMADDSLGDRKSCQEPGCNEVVDGRVVYCNIHSAGRSYQQNSYLQSAHKSSDLYMPPVKGSHCTKPGSSTVTCTEQDVHVKYDVDDQCKLKDSSRNTQGDTGQVIFHGADICKYENCRKQAQVNTVYCKIHSGGTKGCMARGCIKAAHGGTPLCIGHGGGKRCIVTGCPNAACGQGRSDHCVRHGGGKRCKFEGCGKGAQGNTDFCIRHGGGRRCKSQGCTKSAQGRTDFCIKHGGGSRCKFVGCNTSAKWGTDFCSVHRKSLSSEDNAAPEALPLPSGKRRRAKKPKKAVKPSVVSQGTVTAGVSVAGSSTQAMGIPVATMVSNRELSHRIVMAAGQAAMAPSKVLPLSIKPPTAAGAVVSAEREAATSSMMPGL
ncbi:uncharacterized protein LOC100841137 isoform X2 [Brachypodium distachyon]|uniref:uncharacterized protein LOC100841137 isoform X2 n=1 Tax=Brachypodium distachyon TaxID=15368 RepID=UPI00071DC91D|nr:uncharacterized protein LOC100841137 isoform X2 [Brachypodium distachyon]|eukprot:XP_014756514.1 uncharacterized protein LOC100841137 isoform X2 [Brachypodium distachyon]